MSMTAGKAMEVLESMGMGADDYILLRGVDGSLVVLLEPVQPEPEQDESDRLFFSVAEQEQAGEPGLILSPM